MNTLITKILAYVGMQDSDMARQTISNFLTTAGITEMPTSFPDSLPPEIEALIPESILRKFKPTPQVQSSKPSGDRNKLDDDYVEKYSAFSEFIRDYGRSYAQKDEHELRF